MKVSYRGLQQDLSPLIQKKLEAKVAKLSKLLEKAGEQEAHVIVTSERHLHRAEITVPLYDHELVGVASDPDLLTALSAAFDRLETQVVKNRGRWREKKRRHEPPVPAEEITPSPAASDGGERPTPIVRVNHHEERKPMTLDEAVMEMGNGQDYLVYRDADKNRVSVLVRRRDGNIDLIES